jgi:hypothetical protein
MKTYSLWPVKIENLLERQYAAVVKQYTVSLHITHTLVQKMFFSAVTAPTMLIPSALG